MVRSTLSVLVLLAIASSALASCSVHTDLGTPCVLVKRDPTDTDESDGIRSIPIKESEVQLGKDFISFGAVECENYVCVRDANTPKGSTPNADAMGICSRACAFGSSTACPSVDPTNLPLTCRALLLDEATVGTICANDPTRCERFFGNSRSPYFCARTLPDAGI
jgi:hypothetical protein